MFDKLEKAKDAFADYDEKCVNAKIKSLRNSLCKEMIKVQSS